MPEGSPGSLGDQQLVDVAAYILQLNKLPAGPRELPKSGTDLKAIRIRP
jgi:hypothetical protein